MRSLAREIVAAAALAAGLPEEGVMDASASDNLTLPRPRVELAFLPDSYTRTGRKLEARRHLATLSIKKELYEVRSDITAHVFADEGAWLEAFERDFVAALPRGLDDGLGNWVRVRVAEAVFRTAPTKRVGAKEIKVFTRLDTLFHISMTGRVTQESEQSLIDTINISAPGRIGGIMPENTVQLDDLPMEDELPMEGESTSEKAGDAVADVQGPDRQDKPGTPDRQDKPGKGRAQKSAAPKQPEPDQPEPDQAETEPMEADQPEVGLQTLEQLAEKYRLASWHSEALHKMMGWEPGKQVSEPEYRQALAALKTRRLGG